MMVKKQNKKKTRGKGNARGKRLAWVHWREQAEVEAFSAGTDGHQRFKGFTAIILFYVAV